MSRATPSPTVIRKWADSIRNSMVGHSVRRMPWDMAHNEKVALPKTDRQSMAPLPQNIDEYGRRPLLQADWSEVEEWDDLAPMRHTFRPVRDEWVEPWTMYDEEVLDDPCWCHCAGSWTAVDPELQWKGKVLCPHCVSFVPLMKVDPEDERWGGHERIVPPHIEGGEAKGKMPKNPAYGYSERTA